MPAGVKLRSLANQFPGDSPSGGNLEFELLLACCAQPLNHGRIEAVLHGQFDWQRFLSLAEHHSVIPRVYRSLVSYSDELPVQDFSLLSARYEENARSALWFTRELIRILKHLEDQGILAMPYKGPALAQILYGDVTARQFSDLDILVRPEDVPKAKGVLDRLGYKPTVRLRVGSERDFIRSGYECPLEGADGAHLIELQWRIVPRLYSIEFDLTSLLQRAGRTELAGRSYATLSWNDLFLVLCVHAAKHLWIRLSWLGDIAELSRSAQIDWDVTWQRAQELGIQRMVGLSCLLAHDLLGSPLPAPVRRWEKDRATEVLTDEIAGIMRGSLPYDIESVSYFRLMLRLRERWRDRSRFLWRLLWTPSLAEWSAVDLPSWLSWLYRGIRLLRLAKRFSGLACTRLAFFFATERPAASPRSTTAA